MEQRVESGDRAPGGRVSRAYGARRTNRAAATGVVDEDSNVAGCYQGERPVETVLEMLECK